MLLILSLLVNMLQFSYIIYERKNDYQRVITTQPAVGKVAQPSTNEFVSYYEEKLCKLLDHNGLNVERVEGTDGIKLIPLKNTK